MVQTIFTGGYVKAEEMDDDDTPNWVWPDMDFEVTYRGKVCTFFAIGTHKGAHRFMEVMLVHDKHLQIGQRNLLRRALAMISPVPDTAEDPDIVENGPSELARTMGALFTMEARGSYWENYIEIVTQEVEEEEEEEEEEEDNETEEEE